MAKESDPSAKYMQPTVNMYLIHDGAPELADIEQLPQNLLDALRVLESDEEMEMMLGSVFVKAFLKLKRNEWQAYVAHLSQWELENTIDC